MAFLRGKLNDACPVTLSSQNDPGMVTIKGWYDVTTEAAMEEAVAVYGPITAAIHVPVEMHFYDKGMGERINEINA